MESRPIGKKPGSSVLLVTTLQYPWSAQWWYVTHCYIPTAIQSDVNVKVISSGHIHTTEPPQISRSTRQHLLRNHSLPLRDRKEIPKWIRNNNPATKSVTFARKNARHSLQWVALRMFSKPQWEQCSGGVRGTYKTCLFIKDVWEENLVHYRCLSWIYA